MSEAFRDASVSIEGATELLRSARSLADKGDLRAAYTKFEAAWEVYQSCSRAIRDVRDELDSVSDGIIQLPMLFGNNSFSSAHEAVLEICRQVNLRLLHPFETARELEGLRVPETPGGAEARRKVLAKLWEEWSSILWMDLPLLKAQIRRERLKFPRQAAENTNEIRPGTDTGKDVVDSGEPIAPDQPDRAAVWLGDGRVQIGSDAPFVLPPSFAIVLQELVERRAADSRTLDDHGGGTKKLREMISKFPVLKPYVTLPGRKGQGGYRTTIRKVE